MNNLIRVPTPLRPYTDGLKEIEVMGTTVRAAIEDLTHQFPGLKSHLYDPDGNLRPYVNVFINEDDVRDLKGQETPVSNGDRLMILPSIAGGGVSSELRPVDHSALRTNQAAIIGLLIGSFIGDAALIVGLTGLIMLVGTLLGVPGFKSFYRILNRYRLLKPNLIYDNPQPHRFAQGVGGMVLALSSLAFLGGLTTLAWVLAWLVIALAGLNLFAGYCVGCGLYYGLNRLGLRGFDRSPPPGTFPGRRPTAQSG